MHTTASGLATSLGATSACSNSYNIATVILTAATTAFAMEPLGQAHTLHRTILFSTTLSAN